jgi:chromosome partitioning protein
VKVVVFASSKGGVGKSTLAFNTAIHAARAGVGVQLADRDPQRSLMDICRRRREMPELGGDNPMLLENVSTVSEAVSLLTESGYARDYLVVDTPGSFMEIISEAVGAADVIVVPLKASPFDLLAQEAVLSAIETLGKTDRVVFVVNMAEARSPLVKDALDAVRSMSPNKPLTVANRLDYARAAISARAAVEGNKDAAGEIGSLWDAIKRVARIENDGKIRRQPSKPGKGRP